MREKGEVDNAIVTIALAIASGALAALALLLGVLLLRQSRSAGAAPPAATAPPAAPAVELLAHDLHEALAQYRTEPPLQPARERARGARLLQVHRQEPERAPRRGEGREWVPSPAERRDRRPRPAPDDAPELRLEDRTAAAADLTSNGEFETLLEQALSTARAIPGADAAAVALPSLQAPLIGTLGLAQHEADRLASTLPSAGTRTRSIAIDYEYEDGAAREPAGRLQRGIAVPISGLPTPGLIVILTRSPETRLGEPQVELLEEIVERISPALASVLEWEAAATPVSVTVRETAGSVESEEGEEVGQVHRFHDR